MSTRRDLDTGPPNLHVSRRELLAFIASSSFFAPLARASSKAIGDGLRFNKADLSETRRWFLVDGVCVEVVAVGGTVGASAGLLVTRLIVPMAGVDQAVFVRRGARLSNQGRSIDASAIVQNKALDELWLSRPRADVPLDEFDLVASRGADAFHMTTRFLGVALRTGCNDPTLVPRSGYSPLIEFALASQHVYEEALYVTELPGADASSNPPFVTDDEICELLHLGNGQDCQTALCKARVDGCYGSLRDQALKLLGKKTRAPGVRKAAARFAAPTWLTFEWNLGARSERQIRLTTEDLFDWGHKLKDKTKRFTLQLHTHAAKEEAPLKDQIALSSQLAVRPGHVYEANSPDVERVSVIQAPYRLGISPIYPDDEWKIRGGAPAHSGLAELWSVRAESLKMRAIWSPDFRPENFWARNYPHEPVPFRSSLDSRDRHEIVALTSRFGERALLGSASVVPKPEASSTDPEGIFIPKPVRARVVLLSSFGSTLRLDGEWAPPAAANLCGGALTIQRWDQSSQLARDTKVVVEYKGFLFPLGHPATLVKETERRLVYEKDLGFVARLVQRFFIRIPELKKTVPFKQQPFSGRGWPFGNITMHSFVSPDLVDPTDRLSEVTELGLGQQAFWPLVGNTGKLVDFEFEDTLSGVKATAPFVFLDNSVTHTADLLHSMVVIYRNGLEAMRRGPADYARPDLYESALNTESETPRRYVARVGSGKVKFAPEDKPGNTSFRVGRFLLDVDIPRPGRKTSLTADSTCCGPPSQPTPAFNAAAFSLPLEEEALKDGDVHQALTTSVELEAANQPPFYPHMRQARIEPGVLALLSNGSRQLALAEIDAFYLRNGFDSDNPGEVYLRFVDENASLNFSSNTGGSGGFANTTTNMSAVSRRRGPIGGSGRPLPQLPGYRYGVASTTNLGAALASASAEEIDPVSMARAGAADPREFFARSLGDAKLCGVVSFVDIVDVVIRASGARAPQIVEELEHAVPIDVIRQIAKDVASELSDEAIGKLPPRIGGAFANLKNLLALAQKAAPADLLAIGGQLVAACRQLRDEIHAAIENPAMLLPQDALVWLEALKEINSSLRGGFPGCCDVIVQNLSSIVADGALGRVEEVLRGDSRLVQLRERVINVRAAIGAIKEARNGDPIELFATLQRELVVVLDGVIDLDAWSLWLDSAQAVLNAQIEEYWNEIVEVLKDKKLQAAVQSARQNLEQEVAHLAETIDKQLAIPDQTNSQLKRAFLEIADIGQSAVAHASELDHTLSNIGTLQPRKQVEEFAKVAQSLRSALDALAKAHRLVALVEEVYASNPAAAAGLVHSYGQWVAVVARYVLLSVFNGVRQCIAKVINDPDAEVRQALKWLDDSIGTALSIVSRIDGAKLYELPTDLGPVYEVLDLLLGAPDPKQLGLQGLRQAKLVTKEKLISEFAAVCDALAILMAPLHDRVAKAGSENVQDFERWLSPSLRARLKLLESGLSDIAKPLVDRSEKGVRDYLRGFADVRSDLAQLIEELGHILSTGDVSALVDVQKIVDQALEQIGIPTSAKVSYDWETEVHPYPGGAGPVFEPLEGTGMLSIKSRMAVDFRRPAERTMSVVATLDAFKINLFGGDPFLTITFKPLQFTAGTGQKSHMTADVEKVEFGGDLSFVRTLQSFLQEKVGILVEPWSEGPGIVVGYQFNKDLITATAFALQNVGFNISCILPFDSQPARFRFGLSRPDKPFLLSAGIYGGGGFVGIQSRADTIEFLESSFEYGLVTAFQFGPATGTGRITAGIYIRVGTRDALLSGFFNASGNADIAGLICVSANFRLQITYESNSGKVSGTATFTVSFSILFEDFAFSVPVAYARKGDSSGNTNKQSNPPALGLRTAHLAVGSHPTIEQRKQAQAACIETDEKIGDLSSSLLKPKNWARYWDAFEETLDECS